MRDGQVALPSQAQLFADAGLDYAFGSRRAAEIIDTFDIPRTDPSQHYELFASISQIHSPRRVLEIGTYRGVFTIFLARLWPDAQIVTYELPSSANLRRDLHDDSDIERHYNSEFDADSQFRDQLFQTVPNIELRLDDSSNLARVNEKFSAAWIDGDHKYPVVAFDIVNALRMAEQRFWIGVDDIRLRRGKGNSESMGSDEGYQCVQRLARAGTAKLRLFYKHERDEAQAISKMSRKHIALLSANMQFNEVASTDDSEDKRHITHVTSPRFSR